MSISQGWFAVKNLCFKGTEALLGVYSLFRLSVDFLPDIDVPRLVVRTDCLGLNARDVEEYVTRPIEAALSSVSSVRRLRSVSQDGLSLVEVEFRWGSDMDLGFIEARSSLDRAGLPQAAGRPTILRFDPSSAPVMTLIVTGDRIEHPQSTRDYHQALMELKEVAQSVVKRRLEQIDGVAYVQVAGGLDREIQVFLDIEKCVFAFITLIYFLRDFKNPLIVGLSIPVSIITTFICMYFLDIHFNIVSLGGLALGIGILVDNSIVVLENIYRYRELGHAPGEAAVRGTQEVGLAITAATLTTMAVFLPLVYIKGMAGALFYQQAVTISLALTASLLVSITLLPMLSSRSWKRRPVRALYRLAVPLAWTIDLFQQVFGAFFALYERVLAGALRHRYAVMVAAFVLLALSGWLAGRLDRELMPSVDRGHLVLRVELPTEASLSATSAAVARLEHRLRQEAGVRSVLASVGIIRESAAGGYRPGLNKAVLELELAEGVPSAD